MDKVALGQVFSEYFGFPCQLSFHRLLQIHHHHNRHHHLVAGAGTIGQLVTDVPSGPSLTPLQETKKKNKKKTKKKLSIQGSSSDICLTRMRNSVAESFSF
jgi:hypothetical protein